MYREKAIFRSQKQQSDDSPELTTDNPEPSDEKEKLRILQWNADGINTKIHELRERCKDLDLDIVLIQESKLRDDQKADPQIPGYATIRVDRKNRQGGGLISFVRKSVSFERNTDECKNGTEVSTFSVKMSKKKWIKISNIYCPPDSQAHEDLRLASEIIPAETDSLIGGDFNGHSLLWPTDDRGTEMEDWAISKDLIVLNDGSPTRVNKATGNESTPDVTLCGRAWNNKTTWRVEDPIGSSDHTPILVEVHTKVKHVNLLPRTTRWKSRKVDWEEFK